MLPPPPLVLLIVTATMNEPEDAIVCQWPSGPVDHQLLPASDDIYMYPKFC